MADNSRNCKHRRSIRLAGYDYTSENGYFITIVTHDRVKIFGEVVNCAINLSDFGRIVYEEWFRTAKLRSNVELFEEEFVVMPNHIHGIIWLTDNSTIINRSTVGAYRDTPLRSPSNTVGAIIRGFKGAVTTRINIQRHVKGIPVWQRNYYEHIIHSDRDYENIANYIYDNPLNWETDNENATSYSSSNAVTLI